jgi:hypothetical protein
MKTETKQFIYTTLALVVVVLPWACGWKKRPQGLKETLEMKQMLERAKSQRPAR